MPTKITRPSAPIARRVGTPEPGSRDVTPLSIPALAIIAVRHAAFPSPPLHGRAVAWARTLRDDPSAAVITTAWFSRIAVLVAGYFAVLAIGFSTEVGFQLSGDPVMNLPARYDAGWYGDIAINGYHFQARFDRQQNVAFFPAYPFAMRVVGYLVGAFEGGVPWERRMARALWGGAILSIVTFVWGASYLARLARDTIGEAHAADLRTFARTRARQDTSKAARSKPPVATDTTKTTGSKPPVAKIPAVPPQRPSSVFVIVGSQYVKVPIDKIPPGAVFPGTGAAPGKEGIA